MPPPSCPECTIHLSVNHRLDSRVSCVTLAVQSRDRRSEGCRHDSTPRGRSHSEFAVGWNRRGETGSSRLSVLCYIRKRAPTCSYSHSHESFSSSTLFHVSTLDTRINVQPTARPRLNHVCLHIYVFMDRMYVFCVCIVCEYVHVCRSCGGLRYRCMDHHRSPEISRSRETSGFAEADFPEGPPV